jgi:hypothetical protein
MQARPDQSNQSTVDSSSLAKSTGTGPESLNTGSPATEKGVTFRVVVLCLALAAFFGYIIPFSIISFPTPIWRDAFSPRCSGDLVDTIAGCQSLIALAALVVGVQAQ